MQRIAMLTSQRSPPLGREEKATRAGDQVYMRTTVRSCIELASRKCLLGFTRVTPQGGRRIGQDGGRSLALEQ